LFTDPVLLQIDDLDVEFIKHTLMPDSNYWYIGDHGGDGVSTNKQHTVSHRRLRAVFIELELTVTTTQQHLIG
jgi:hypothetical protein